MGIQIEFNPDLALRDIAFFDNGERNIEECIPKELEIGNEYNIKIEKYQNNLNTFVLNNQKTQEKAYENLKYYSKQSKEESKNNRLLK